MMNAVDVDIDREFGVGVFQVRNGAFAEDRVPVVPGTYFFLPKLTTAVSYAVTLFVILMFGCRYSLIVFLQMSVLWHRMGMS